MIRYGKPKYFTGEEPYKPSEWVKPLSPDAPSDGPKARAFACRVYKQETGEFLVLDDYQEKLIDSILELYPDDYFDEELAGMLRFRQAIVSIPRRNGKSTIAAVLILYSVCFSLAPNIGVFASTREQAAIVFNSVKYNFVTNPALSARFKVTIGKGIESKDPARPGRFKVFTSSGDALQGQGFNGLVPVINDELHITKPEAYDAAVKGASTNPSAVVVGITTAGSEDSELLKRLYKVGQKAIRQDEGYNDRFGFWHWTVDADIDLWDYDALKAANPAAWSKPPRINIKQEIMDGKSNPAGNYAEYRRYRRNEFVSSDDAWMPLDQWAKCAGNGIPEDYTGPIHVGVDKVSGWDYICLVAACKIEGKVYTEVVAILKNRDIDYLGALCQELSRKNTVITYAFNNMAFRDFIKTMKEVYGLPAIGLTETQLTEATGTTSALIGTKRLVHADDPVIREQLPKASVQNTSEGVKISVNKSHGHVYSVRATIMAVYIAETTRDTFFVPFVVKKKN